MERLIVTFEAITMRIVSLMVFSTKDLLGCLREPKKLVSHSTS